MSGQPDTFNALEAALRAHVETQTESGSGICIDWVLIAAVVDPADDDSTTYVHVRSERIKAHVAVGLAMRSSDAARDEMRTMRTFGDDQ